MSKYTTQLRWIVEHYAKQSENISESSTLDEQVKAALSKIFSFPYPIWDTDYKETLETKIVYHYLFREIAFETVNLWRTFLFRKLNEIMPYYNQLYQTTTLDYKYQYDLDIYEEIKRDRKDDTNSSFNQSENSTGESTNTGKLTGETTSNGKDVSAGKSHNSGTTTAKGEYLHSDFPQATNAQSIGGDFYASSIDKENREGTSTDDGTNDITTTTENSGSTTSNSSNTNNSTSNTDRQGTSDNHLMIDENIESHRYGHQSRPVQDLVKSYRETLLNIDMLIINELEPLFMQIY